MSGRAPGVPAGVGADHIWFDARGADPAWCRARPALFLDRDGVVVNETNYLHRVADVVLIDGAERAIGAANRLGMPVIMVTNQAGIGRGYYGWDDFAAVSAFIQAALGAAGARVDALVACPFHAQGTGVFRCVDHPMRKPNPGMFRLAGDYLQVDFGASLVIGDKACDLRAGRAAGLRRGIHVLTGHGRQRRAEAEALAGADFRVEVADSIGADTVLRQLGWCAARGRAEEASGRA